MTLAVAAVPTRVPRWAWWAVLVVLAALAFVVRYRLLVQSGGLLGSDGYDDGVYYAAADALVHGRLPYRDFLLLQPPGTVVALTPFAWIGSITTDPRGEILGRLAFIGIGAINTVLLASIGRRFGVIAGVLAGVVYAVLLPAAYAERSTLLEPLGTCGLLVSVLLATGVARRPRLMTVLAGAAAGVAIGMRIWFIVPALAILVVTSIERRRSPLPYLAGATASTFLIYLPFFLPAPVAMFRQVVLDQLGRSRSSGAPAMKRIDSILGAADLHLTSPWSAVLSPHKLGLVLGIAIVVLAIVAWRVRGARLFPVTAAVTIAVLLASPSYFGHYASFAAPWLVLTGAIGAARLLSHLRLPRWRVLIAGVLLLLVIAVNGRALAISRSSSPIPAGALHAAAQRVTGCVTSDDPQILIALDVLSRDYRRGCMLWPDVTGYTYDRDALPPGSGNVSRMDNTRWQADVTRYLLSGDAVIVHRAGTALSPASARQVRSGPVLARSGTWVLHAVTR